LILDQGAIVLLASRARDARAGGQNAIKPVPSPCVAVCQMDEDVALCRGCLRTLDEIGRWRSADDDQRRAIWRNIETRLAQHSP
jgi:predicted Fe-S protein YdhL (DUF1289 family)